MSHTPSPAHKADRARAMPLLARPLNTIEGPTVLGVFVEVVQVLAAPACGDEQLVHLNDHVQWNIRPTSPSAPH